MSYDEHQGFSDEDRRKIISVLEAHRIRPDETWQGILFTQSDRACAVWLNNKRYPLNIATRPDLIGEIKRLQRAIKNLSHNTRDVLMDSCLTTQAHAVFEKSNLYNPLAEYLTSGGGDEIGVYSLSHLAFNMLAEACGIALKTGGPSMMGSNSSIDDNAKSPQRGRPINFRDIDFVTELARAFKMGTGKKPSQTPSGPFWDFLDCILGIVEPDHHRVGLRKLIRAALKNYVP
jgi:hypothetical protein